VDGLESVLRSHPVAPGSVALMWLEQSHFVFKTPWGLLIHVDPFLSRTVNPENHIRRSPFIDPDRAPADFVFLTHDHRDHTDPDTLLPMARVSPGCRFFGPPESCARLLSLGIDPVRIVEVVEGETVRLNGFTVTAVFAQNTSAHDETMHLGFVFDFEGKRIYHTGDTRKDPDSYLNRLKAVTGLRPDALIVPINAGYNNPGAAGAARITEIVDPRVVVPCHWNCFLTNTADPAAFERALPASRRPSLCRLDPGTFITP
jgi:L-ascorbate metabolism protein UlaG (beta-lactamase superfamily)